MAMIRISSLLLLLPLLFVSACGSAPPVESPELPLSLPDRWSGAETSDDAPERVVLWDPITDGARYLRRIRRAQAELVERNFNLTGSERREGQQDYGTYRLSERMAEELGAFDLSACLGLPSDKLFVVSTSVDARFPVEGVVPEVVDHR